MPLGRTDCDNCNGYVLLQENPRPLREAEAHGDYSSYGPMQVADAVCERCGARYLAWVTYMKGYRPEPSPPFVDLVYRSTFSVRPGPEDLPGAYLVTEVRVTHGDVVDHVEAFCGPVSVGTLVVPRGSGGLLAQRLRPFPAERALLDDVSQLAEGLVP